MPIPSDYPKFLINALRKAYPDSRGPSSYSSRCGFLQSLVEGLPDTPENRAYISRMILDAEDLE